MDGTKRYFEWSLFPPHTYAKDTISPDIHKRLNPKVITFVFFLVNDKIKI